jgi:hypothetical protein
MVQNFFFLFHGVLGLKDIPKHSAYLVNKEVLSIKQLSKIQTTKVFILTT